MNTNRSLYSTLLLGFTLCACVSTAPLLKTAPVEVTSCICAVGPEQIDPNSTDARAPKERVIYFEYNKSEILPQYVDIITKHANHIALNKSGRIRIIGHTDVRGSRKFNFALGNERAKTVERMMLELGVNPKQLRTSSYGEEMPVDDLNNRDEIAWAKNRRAVIIYDSDITMEP